MIVAIEHFEKREGKSASRERWEIYDDETEKVLAVAYDSVIVDLVERHMTVAIRDGVEQVNTSKFFKIFTGCDVGEVRASILKGCEVHTAGEILANKGLLQRELATEGRVGYSLTEAGKVKADARVGKIG